MASGFGLTVLAALLASALVVAGIVIAAGGSEPAENAGASTASTVSDEQAGARPERRPAGPSRREERRDRRADAARARERAAEFATGREGRVAFAVVGPDGVLRGADEHDLFQSASLVKAMILASYLQELDREGLPLESSARSLLTSMITVSDNDAATQAFESVGPEGLEAIGQRAGMRDLETSYVWGATRISAADAALFFADLDRVIPKRFESFGEGLLGSISPDQSWGIPAVARPLGWKVRFKGGWRPDPTGQIVNQAAELRRGERTISIAVLSDQGPSFGYGVETVEGIATRLLGGG